MNVNDYLLEKFPSLQLVSSIYHQWEIGIHFTLGENIYQFKENGELNLDRFQLIYEQTSTIFHELFDDKDELFLVANFYKVTTQEKLAKRLKIYHPFLKNKKDVYRIRVKTFPYPFEHDEDEKYGMQQFSLQCKCGDLKVQKLLKATCHEDFPLKPKFGKYINDYPDVFFVNRTKDLVFFIYDDRGCEVVALDGKQLLPLVEKFGAWVEGKKGI